MNALAKMRFDPDNEVTELKMFCVKPIYMDWKSMELIGASARIYVDYTINGERKFNIQTVETFSEHDSFFDCYGGDAINEYVQETVFDDTSALKQVAWGSDYVWSEHDAECVERCLSIFGEYNLGANVRLFNGFEVNDRRPQDFRKGIDIYLHQYTGSDDRMYPVRSKDDLLICLQAPVEGAERVKMIDNLHTAGCTEVGNETFKKRRM
ncbi:hypothetical protein [Stenotrophomonas acidaminiphila]